MRHFNFFENGGPFPSACLSCGNNTKLFDLGRELQGNGGMAQLCLTCISELAEFTGFAPSAPMVAEIASLKSDIVSRETELAKVPTKVEDLINGIRSSVTDFIFAVSYSDDTDKHTNVSNDEPAANADSKQRETTPRNTQASRKPAVN
jgi:hypothetical protein